MFLGAKNNLEAEGTAQSATPGQQDCCAGECPDESKTALSPAAVSLIQSNATFAVLMAYAKYLIKTGKADGKEAVAAEIGKIASAAMDAGQFTSSSLDRLLECIKYKCRVESPTEEINQCLDKMREHIFDDMTCSMSYDESILDTLTDDEKATINAAVAAWRTYIDLNWKVKEMFGAAIDTAINTVLTTYKDKFDAGFAAAFCKN